MPLRRTTDAGATMDHDQPETLCIDDIELVEVANELDLELELELEDENTKRMRRPKCRSQAPRRRFPAALSDAAVARLVDECTAELCRNPYQAYVY